MGLLLEAQVKATKAKAKTGNLQGMISDHMNMSLMASGYLTSAPGSNGSVLSSQAKANIQQHTKLLYYLGYAQSWEDKKRNDSTPPVQHLSPNLVCHSGGRFYALGPQHVISVN